MLAYGVKIQTSLGVRTSWVLGEYQQGFGRNSVSCWELSGTGESSENFVFEDTTSEDRGTPVKLGRSRLRVRQGSKGGLKGFKETGPSIGQCRTACGGDKQGP